MSRKPVRSVALCHKMRAVAYHTTSSPLLAEKFVEATDRLFHPHYSWWRRTIRFLLRPVSWIRKEKPRDT